MDEENRHVWETNRTRKKKPKSGYGWCSGCDANLVPQDGTKCNVCGTVNGIRKFKKKG